MSYDRLGLVRLLEVLYFLVGKLHVYTLNDVLQILQARRSNDRSCDAQVLVFGEAPGDGDLSHRDPFFLSYFFDTFDDGCVSWVFEAIVKELVCFAALRLFAYGTGKDATTERRPRDGAHAKHLESREHLSLFFAVDQTVMVLHGDERGEPVRDRVVLHGMELIRVARAHADIPHIPSLDDIVKSLHSFFNWGGVVEAMALQQINIIKLEAL